MKTLFSYTFITSKLFAANMLITSALIMPAAQAGLLLDVDLSVENTITINALDGNALISESSGLIEGIYFDGFFGNAFSSSINDSLVSSNISSANNTSGLFDDLFHFGNDPGLNLFSFNSGTASFVAGELAFVGTGTWTISNIAYQSALNGAQSGDLFFPADSINDIANLSAIGSWSVSNGAAEVPAPSVLLFILLGVAGVMFSRKKAHSQV